MHIQKPDKIALFLKVFLTWSTSLENYHFFFFRHDLWHFLSFCGIFGSFNVEKRNINSESAIWGGSSQTWNVPNCLLVDVGCSYNACKGTKYSARVPPPSCIPRTIWMLCHSHVPFWDLHRLAHFLLCRVRPRQLWNKGVWGKGRECAPSCPWKNLSPFPFLPKWGKIFKMQFYVCTFYYWVICAAFLKIVHLDNLYKTPYLNLKSNLIIKI